MLWKRFKNLSKIVVHVRGRDTIEVMQNIAIARSGRCLSSNYKDSKTKIKWVCLKDHIWEALLLNIKRRSWCPYCEITTVNRK